MLIRLVGTVRIERDGVAETVTAAKRACVLAVLAASPGVAVSRADLIDRVWDGRPPEAVMSVLYSHVTRLREALDGTAATISRAGPDGYTLDVAPGEVDVHAARALAARPSPGRLRRARELADGIALNGIEGRWAREFRDGFAAERLGVLNALHSAELAAGNHEAVLPELIALAHAEPDHEPFVHNLMLAYVRCGRPAEALTRFESFRLRLRARLGAEPSEELRSLHLRILDQDTGLRPGPPVPRPAMLPTDIGTFTGRDGELAALDALALDGSTAAITGPGGVGKTGLAVHWGHSRRADFAGGQVYLNLRGFDRGAAVGPAEALERLLTALGVAGDAIPSDVDEAGALYRELTAGRDLLLVLDNARDSVHVRPLLPGDGCTTLVTSRDRLAGLVADEGARHVPVPVLSRGEAAELVERVLGAPRVAAEKEAAARFAELCGRLPLALRIASAHLSVQPGLGIAEYAADLAGSDPLWALSVDGDPAATVDASLDLSHRVLTEDARGLFARIGFLPGEDVSRALLEAVGGLDAERLAAALGQLVGGHLLEEHVPGRYRMHDLVRWYAKGKADRDLGAAGEELADAFIDWHFAEAYRTGGDEQSNVVIAAEVLRGH
ncbi:MAG TPA: BTAD domain-containing putative transcriptional regulator, partial [Phytomonospora sp.]